jgi:SAM-dependent methyltransferase
MATPDVIAADDAYHGIFGQLRKLDIYDDTLSVDLYGEQFADFYNRFVGDYAGDIPVFQRLLADTPDARVLDLACGSGRIGIAMARGGATVDGLELSPHMLDLVEGNLAGERPDVRARLRFMQGDMGAFDLPDRYDLILVGVTSISLLLAPAQRSGLFACARRHLKPGGKFVFDILDLEGERWRRHDHYLDVWAREVDEGQDFAIVGQRFYPERRQFAFNVYREVVGWDGQTSRAIGTSVKAWLERGELIEAMAAEGLVLVEEFEQGEVRFFVAQAAA